MFRIGKEMRFPNKIFNMTDSFDPRVT